MELSKIYERNQLCYTWDIINVTEKDKALIDLMIEMDGIEFINYERFKLDLSSIEQDFSWFGVYIDLIVIWFGEKSRIMISDIFLAYESSF